MIKKNSIATKLPHSIDFRPQAAPVDAGSAPVVGVVEGLIDASVARVASEGVLIALKDVLHARISSQSH